MACDKLEGVLCVDLSIYLCLPESLRAFSPFLALFRYSTLHCLSLCFRVYMIHAYTKLSGVHARVVSTPYTFLISWRSLSHFISS